MGEMICDMTIAYMVGYGLIYTYYLLPDYLKSLYTSI